MIIHRVENKNRMVRVKDASSEPRYRFYTPERLSKNISKTNEGYLLCEGVPLARTGVQVYLPEEVAGEVEAGRDGIVRIQRDPDVVFHPDTIASFNGKPFTLGHPDDGVDPENWNELAAGVIMNPRQGVGIEDDLLIGDILVTKQEAIDQVLNNTVRELSCGYDADYEQIQPGLGRQINIRGNHVAFVPEGGRAGSRCAIRDRRPQMKLSDRIKKAFATKDEKALDAALAVVDNQIAEAYSYGSGGEGGGTNIHLHMGGKDSGEELKTEKTEEEGEKMAKDAEAEKEEKNEERFKKMEDTMAKICDALKISDKKGGDEASEEEAAGSAYEQNNGGKKTGDSAATLQLKFKDLASRAEILVPGFKLPSITVDSKDPQKVVDSVTRAKRRILDSYYTTDQGREDLEPFMTGDSASFDKMPVHMVDSTFIAVSEMARRRNNTANTRDSVTTKDFGRQVSIADINAKNAKFWSDQRKQG